MICWPDLLVQPLPVAVEDGPVVGEVGVQDLLDPQVQQDLARGGWEEVGEGRVGEGKG